MIFDWPVKGCGIGRKILADMKKMDEWVSRATRAWPSLDHCWLALLALAHSTH